MSTLELCKSIPAHGQRFEVVTRMGDDSWGNCWHISADGKPDRLQTFATEQEAHDALSNHLGRLSGSGMDSDPDDFDVRPVPAHAHLAVFGRMDGDDEDTVNLYHDLTTAEADAAFIEEMRLEEQSRTSEGGTPRDTVYVNYILTSASPIDIAVSNTF